MYDIDENDYEAIQESFYFEGEDKPSYFYLSEGSDQ